MPQIDTVESKATLMGDGSILPSSSFKGSENLTVDSISDENLLLEDWESYWDDLSARLTVSRMVSDSVIRGIVNAVVQEAAESNSLKEAEITRLIKRLQLYEPDAVTGRKSVLSQVLAGTTSKVQFSCSYPRKDDSGHICTLNIAAEKHLLLLKSGIECIRRSNYCKMMNSGSETFRFCCVHDDLKVSDNLTQIDKSIDALGIILATLCQQTGDMSYSLKDSPYEQQWQWEFQKEVDTIIFQSFMKEQREEFDMKLCEQKSLFDIQNNFWMKKVHELSSLHEELDSISKAILNMEPEHPFSHSLEESFEERNNNRRKDQFAHKMHRDNIATDSSHVKVNGFVSTEKAEKGLPEVAESSLLLHMNREELVSYYQNEINKIKRQLESSLHEKTEELFRLKREFLRERGSLHCRRDKDFESVKKVFPEVVLKLDKVLLETKNFSAVQDHHDKTCSFKQRIECLGSENRRLCDLLVDRGKEVDHLSSQVSDAEKQLSSYSITEANLLKEKNKLKGEIEDLKAEIFIKGQVDKCIVSELVHRAKCQMEDLQMETMMIEELCGFMLKRSIMDVYPSMNPIIMCDNEKKKLATIISQKEKALDLEVEKTEQLKQELASLTSLISEKESALSLEVKKSEQLNQELASLTSLISERESALSLEVKKTQKLNLELVSLASLISERESALSLEVKKTQKLNLELVSLSALMEVENNFISDVEYKLAQQKKHLDIFSEELNSLKGQASGQKKLISEDNRESNLLKTKLNEALNQIQHSDAKMSELNQRLTIVSNDLKEAEKQKAILCGIVQQQQSEILSVTAQVEEQTEQLESIVIFVEELSKSVAEFERNVVWNIERRSSRLEALHYQCDALIKHADVLKMRELWYKKRLETRSSDLEKAEVEVDLLGDEVDALLNVLEKIYIALDHYSPILQHYPGVTEILKLVRRELKGSG